VQPNAGPAPRRGTALTRDTVIDAAADLVHREGYRALTIRGLANRLGVGAMTLYSYVRTKDDLLGALAERFLFDADLSFDEGLPWREQLAELFETVRREFLEHPELVPFVARQRLVGPGPYRGMEMALRILRCSGLTDAQCVDAFGALIAFTIGSVQREIGLREAGAVAFPGLGGLPQDGYTNVIEVASLLAARDPAHEFSRGLDLLLRGIEAWIDNPDTGAADREQGER